MSTRSSFNFGPISRTLGDGIGFAPLPMHEATTALLGAQNRIEFITWLVHDTFKPLFNFCWGIDRKGNPKMFWQHFFMPNVKSTHYLKQPIRNLAIAAGVNPEYINKHHGGIKMLSESVTIANEFDQVYLGEKARFLQLTFKCQPAACTLLLRLAIVEAFLRTTSKLIARAIAGLGLGFEKVKYTFAPMPSPIALENIAALYKLEVKASTLSITHLVPSSVFEETYVQIDLTDKPQDRTKSQEIGLSELLTVYRDDLTIIVALPLFIADPDSTLKEINNLMRAEAHEVVNQMGIVTKHKNAIVPDLLNVVIDEQVELRPVYPPHVSNKGRVGNRITGKSIYKLVRRPYELQADSSLASSCLVCGSPIKGGRGRYFDSGKRVIEDIFSSHFSDFEHLSLQGSYCGYQPIGFRN